MRTNFNVTKPYGVTDSIAGYEPVGEGANPSKAAKFIKEIRYEINLVYCRIGVINDFNNTTAFVWVQLFGDKATKWMMSTDCSITSGPHKGYQDREDGIWIFLDFKKVAVFKNKGEAKARIEKLIDKAPRELKKEIETFQDYLFRALERRPMV